MIAMEKRFNVPVSEAIATLLPYPPGKPIEELERELGIKGSIKLASNENPLGPSPKAVKAVQAALENIHRYPDGSCHYLREALAAHLSMPTASIILGNGSNEIIELLIRAYLKMGDEVVMADPSFAVYPIVVKAAGAKAVSAPLKGFRHDLPKMAGLITDRTRIVFIANPNNPTGTTVSETELKSFMQGVPEDVIVCVDEAYFEFVRTKGFPATLDYINEGKNVLLLRTFSKVYGLAGLRVGYGVGRPEMIDYMNRVRQPFNVNSLAQAAAKAALDDVEHLKNTIENNVIGLDYLFKELGAMGLECVPTEANFFLVKVVGGKGVYEALLRKGVIVRPMASYNMPDYIRVSVGLPQENKRFVASLKDVLNTSQGTEVL